MLVAERRDRCIVNFRFSGRGFLTRLSVAAFVVVTVVLATADAGEQAQTDWSEGPQPETAVSSWGRGFSSVDGVSWLANPGRLVLSGEVLENPEYNPISTDFRAPASLDAVDLDDDGDLDLIGAAAAGNRVSWWRNEGGTPPVWTEQIIESGFRGVVSVRGDDIDGDGFVDVVGGAWDAGEIVVWFNGGHGLDWTRQNIASELAGCHWVDTADLDGDGDRDLLGAAANVDTVAVWFNDGALPPSWTMQIVDDAYGGARSLTPADLDGDGDADLIGTALVDDDLSWWRNDGGDPVVWTRLVISGNLAGSHHADAWDIDLDGDLDILAAGFGYPYIKVFRNDGGEPVEWREERLGGPIMQPLVVGVADLDGDGDLDVAATSNYWHTVKWWENTGDSPADWSATNIGTNLTNAWPLVIADLDGNGSVDVASGASGGSEVSWWRMTDFVSAGTLTSSVLNIPDDLTGVSISLDVEFPPGTGASVQLRAGSSMEALGDWISAEPGEVLPFVISGPAYLQYRIRLETSDPTASPIVREVFVEWTSGLPSRSAPERRVTP